MTLPDETSVAGGVVTDPGLRFAPSVPLADGWYELRFDAPSEIDLRYDQSTRWGGGPASRMRSRFHVGSLPVLPATVGPDFAEGHMRLVVASTEPMALASGTIEAAVSLEVGGRPVVCTYSDDTTAHGPSEDLAVAARSSSCATTSTRSSPSR